MTWIEQLELVRRILWVAFWIAVAVLLVQFAWAGTVNADEGPWMYSLLMLKDHPPAFTLCSISVDGQYKRGETLSALSCMDFYGRIIAYGTLADVQYFGAYACWALDPCGWPK